MLLQAFVVQFNIQIIGLLNKPKFLDTDLYKRLDSASIIWEIEAGSYPHLRPNL